MYTYLLFKETNNHYKEYYFLVQKYKNNFNVIWKYIPTCSFFGINHIPTMKSNFYIYLYPYLNPVYADGSEA